MGRRPVFPVLTESCGIGRPSKRLLYPLFTASTWLYRPRPAESVLLERADSTDSSSFSINTGIWYWNKFDREWHHLLRMIKYDRQSIFERIIADSTKRSSVIHWGGPMSALLPGHRASTWIRRQYYRIVPCHFYWARPPLLFLYDQRNIDLSLNLITYRQFYLFNIFVTLYTCERQNEKSCY